jgi:hypothetical protein
VVELERRQAVEDLTQPEPLQAEKAHAARLARGRTFDEQVAAIRNCGNHGASPVLRLAALAAHGISNPKARAANGLIFGCYRPFTTPFLLWDYIKLLDLLGVDYTWFEKEYCCGLPLVMESDGAPTGKIAEAGEDFNRRNAELARAKEVETLAYCCVGCVYAAKRFSPFPAERQLYILDLILDALGNRALEMPPTALGYFEGCHSFYRARFPGINLNWQRYRQALENIKGLTIVDLPNTLCCKRSGEQILEQADQLKLDRILCPCNGCYGALKAAAQGKIELMNYPEVLLQSLNSSNHLLPKQSVPQRQ